MYRHVFDEHLKELHNELLRMGSMVERQIYDAIKSLVEQDTELAQKVITGDNAVNDLEKEIEDKGIKLIATQQPLAHDLRNIFTTSKIVTDLERIADLAVNIAEITIKLKDEKYVKQLIDIPRMAEIVKEMVKDSIDSYVEGNVTKAEEVCQRDDTIDAYYKQIFSELLLMMMENPKIIKQASEFLFVCRHLERIGDHATNIGEWTIYLVTGEM